MTISQRIFEELKKQGKKQKDLADYVGVSTSAISDWKKKGTNPASENIASIAEFLNVSTYYILTGKENENNVEQKETNNQTAKFIDNGTYNGSVNKYNESEVTYKTFNSYPQIVGYLDSLSLRERRRAELDIIEFLEDNYPVKKK